MVARTPFVDLGDMHGPLSSADKLIDPATSLPFLTAADGGSLKYYADLATAVADAANLTLGQNVIIGGGDSGSTGAPNADRGIWQITSSPIDAANDFTLRLNVSDHASEVFLADAGGFYAGTDVEAALQEVGGKQLAYKRADTSLYAVSVSGASTTAFDTALKALVLDNGSFTDATGAGNTINNGIIINTTKAHKLPIRRADNNNSIEDGNGNEVYARLTQNAGNYVVSFYSDVNGTETAYTFGSSTAIDLAFVWTSMDFMKLPALAGISEAEFFGDQGGMVGVIDDANITTGPFTGLLTGKSTQEQVNDQVDKLGMTTAGKGASLVAIEDAGLHFTGTNVETALTELWTKIENHQMVRYFNTLALARAQAALDQDWQINDIIAITGPGANAAERGLYTIAPSVTLVTAGSVAAINVSAKTITFAGGVVLTGVNAGDTVVLTGTTDNDGTYTVTGSVVGQVVTVVEAMPGTNQAAPAGTGTITSTTPNGTFVGDHANDYLKIIDISHTASEVAIVDSLNYYASTDVEGALAEIGAGIAGSQKTLFYDNLAAAVAGQVAQKVGDVIVIYGDVGNEGQSGIWRMATKTGNASDYTLEMDKSNTASEVAYVNTGTGLVSTNVQTVITEIWTAVRNTNGLHDYVSLAASIAAANSTWLIGDYVIVAGTTGSNAGERGIYEITAKNGTNPGDNALDYTKVLDITHTASEIPIVDAGGLLGATEVEGALQELAQALSTSQMVRGYDTLSAALTAQAAQNVGDIIVIKGTTPNEADRGVYRVNAKTNSAGDYVLMMDISHIASEVLISNGGGASFTGTTTQAALNELLSAIGGTTSAVRDYSSNNYVADNDSLVVAVGKLDAAIAAASLSYLTCATYTAGEAIALTTGPKLVSMTTTASSVKKTVAGSTGTLIEIAGFAVGTADLVSPNPIPKVVSEGVLGGFTGLTAGAAYYADPTTAGAITSTVPSTVGQWVVPVGVAKSATELIVRIGEPTEIVPASKAVQRNIWFVSSGATGMGTNAFAVAVGDIWIDDDTTVQNPTKSGTGKYTVYVCKQAWTGAGLALTAGNISTYFVAIGKQN
jgi:hypothetical protein